jgi:hypothetical protein
VERGNDASGGLLAPPRDPNDDDDEEEEEDEERDDEPPVVREPEPEASQGLMDCSDGKGRIEVAEHRCR